MSGINETLIQGMKKSILMPPDMQLTLSEGKIMSIKEVLFWILLDELFVDIYFQSYPDYNRKAELVRWLRSKVPERTTKNCRDIWYVGGRMLEEMVNLEHICSSSEDPSVEQSFQAVRNENGHKFNMTEGEHVILEAITSLAREGKATAGSPVTMSEDQDEMLPILETEKFTWFPAFPLIYIRPMEIHFHSCAGGFRLARNNLKNRRYLEYSRDPPEEQSCQSVVNQNGHKFNMTEDEYNFWKDMPEKLKDVLIEIIPEKAEVVGRLRSEACEGKAKAGLPASQELKTRGGSSTIHYTSESSDRESRTSSTQADNEPAEHTNLETEGGSSTAQNEPLPNHQGLPVGGDHQVHNVQVNWSMNQTVNYAPESSDIESGTSSTQADNEPAEHTNLETGGGFSTAQIERPPNHQGLAVGGDHQVHNVQVNGSMADNEPAEHTNPETGGGSLTAQNETPPNHQVLPVVGDHQVHNVQVNGSMVDNESAEYTNPETGGGSSTAQNEPPPNHQVLLVGLDFVGDGDHQVHNLQVREKLEDMLIPMCPKKAEVVGRLRSKAHERKAKAGSGDFLPSLAFQDTISKVNLWISLAFISAPIFLDGEYYKDRNSVSYKVFVAFMICIILSFTGAFCALLIRNKPKLAVLRGCYFLLSIVSMASALSTLGYALFWKV